MKIGFIGAGQMAEAIFSGLLRSGLVAKEEVTLIDIARPRLEQMAATYGVNIIGAEEENSYRRLLDASEIVFFAIKPQFASDLLAKIGGDFKPEHLVVSIMGGVTIDYLEERIANSKIIRVMPNTPMLVNEGAVGIALGRGCSEAEGELMLKLFRSVGIAYLMQEKLIDPLTGVSGCGPAFCYMFLEALADGGVMMGLPRQMAMELAAKTMMGAAKMVLETGDHPGKLKDNVCSPGGGTIAGVHALEKGGFRGTVINAVEDSVNRMIEVGKKA